MDYASTDATDSVLKKKVLFLNADAAKPQCALYQAGKRYGAAMDYCEELDVTYYEVSSTQTETLPTPSDYDAVIFNYQHSSMKMMPGEYFSHCSLAIGFLYEARQKPQDSPMHFGDQTCGQLFDILISPDPTLESTPNIWATDRIVPRAPRFLPVILNGRHIVSTFGFPSPWKKLDEVVRMMNAEFESGTFRLNFPRASHQEGTVNRDSQNDQYEDMLVLLAEVKALAKPGIEVVVTHDFMSEEELIQWLHQSDLNVFLSQETRAAETGGALLASADVAIAAQRPLMVSDNSETRHLKNFIFPDLTTAIDSQKQLNLATELASANCSPDNFARRIDECVNAFL